MKILHALGWYFPDSVGGTEIYVKALAERQRARQHDVQVAAPSPGSSRGQIYDHEGIPVFRYPTPPEPTRDEAQGRVPARGSEVFRDHLETWRPDILHVHTFTTGLGIYELEAARDLGIRIVATNHLGSVGYLCQRGTLMRWGEYPCDGVVERMKCAACQLQAGGLPKLVAWAVGAAGHLAGRVLADSPGRFGTAMGMTDLIAHNQRLQQRTLEIVDRFVLLNKAARDIVVLNGGNPKKLDLKLSRPEPSKLASKAVARGATDAKPCDFRLPGAFRHHQGSTRPGARRRLATERACLSSEAPSLDGRRGSRGA